MRNRLGLALLTSVVLATYTPAQALQCVPYARDASGIGLRGDAWTWWNHAAGLYERGQAARVGAVIVFRKHGKMRLGHVAVVAKVVGAREILVDHANWGNRHTGRGHVSTMVAVRDVSPRNDWTAVQVWNVATNDFGTQNYPTYGFIYPRGEQHDRDTTTASADLPAEIARLLASPDAGPDVDTAGADLGVLSAVLTVDPLEPAPRPYVSVESLTWVSYFPASDSDAALTGIWEGDHEAAIRAGSHRY